MNTQVTYALINDTLVESNSEVLNLSNRSFRYGDGLFESIRIMDGKVPFLKYHLERLKRGCDFLKLKSDSIFEQDALQNKINLLIEKNKLQHGGKLRITVYREDGGLYAPEKNSAHLAMEVAALENNRYELNTKGLHVDLYTEIKKQAHALSTIKTNNCIPYVMASIYKSEKKLDDCILVNDKGNVCEAISSNLFLVINGALYTPAIAEGCLDGVMRKIILENARSHKINIYEPVIMPNDLLRADEVFLTNSVKGIQWVGSYKNKRYFNSTSKRILGIINNLIH